MEGCTAPTNARNKIRFTNNSNDFNLLWQHKNEELLVRAVWRGSKWIRQVEAAKIVPPGQDFPSKTKSHFTYKCYLLSPKGCGKTVETSATAAAALWAAGRSGGAYRPQEGFWEIVSERKGWITEHSVKAGHNVLEENFVSRRRVSWSAFEC